MPLGKNTRFSDSEMESLITDYVDGTMDEVTRSVFEQLLAQDPLLKAEVCRMKEVRNFMCGLNCGCTLEANEIAQEVRKQAHDKRCAVGLQLPKWLVTEENVRVGIGLVSVSVVLLILTGGVLYKQEARTKWDVAGFMLPAHPNQVQRENSALPNKVKPKNIAHLCLSKTEK